MVKIKTQTQKHITKSLNISTPALSRYEFRMFNSKSLAMVYDFEKIYNVLTNYLISHLKSKAIVYNPNILKTIFD